MSVDAGFKHQRVISRGKTVAGSEFQSLEVKGIKRVGVSAGTIFIQFDSEGVLSVRKPRVSSKDGFRRDN